MVRPLEGGTAVISDSAADQFNQSAGQGLPPGSVRGRAAQVRTATGRELSA